jgi:hypothetical protein
MKKKGMKMTSISRIGMKPASGDCAPAPDEPEGPDGVEGCDSCETPGVPALGWTF